MKQMDYVVEGAGAQRTITPRSDRAKQRTPGAVNFATIAEALEFVKAGVAEGLRFSGRELVDRGYRLVRYGYFMEPQPGQFVEAGHRDWGPPDPVFEIGDVYPGGPRGGKHADITNIIVGDEARRVGVDVMVTFKERDVSRAD
jgi:hypothetical protein